jgi:hypothetical protein
MHTSIEKIDIGIEIEFSDMKIIEIDITFVYRNITIIDVEFKKIPQLLNIVNSFHQEPGNIGNGLAQHPATRLRR